MRAEPRERRGRGRGRGRGRADRPASVLAGGRGSSPTPHHGCAIDAAMRSLFDLPTGLLLSGSAFALVLAYTIRFLAASLGAVEAGLGKISRNTDAAARTLGATATETLWRVHLPLLRPRSAPRPSSSSSTR